MTCLQACQQRFGRVGLEHEGVRADSQRGGAGFGMDAEHDQLGASKVAAGAQEGGGRPSRQLPVQQNQLRLKRMQLLDQTFEVRALRDQHGICARGKVTLPGLEVIGFQEALLCQEDVERGPDA